MIVDSMEWKKELRERKRQLLVHCTKESFERDLEKSCFKIERALLYSAFIIRTLIESKKLSDEVDSYMMNVDYFLPLKKIDINRRWLLDGNEYNWDVSERKTVLGKDVCNWIIHSFVFLWDRPEDSSMVGFFVSTDYDKNKVLYSVSLKEWTKYLDYVITDDVVGVTATNFGDEESDDAESYFVTTQKKRGIRERTLKV